jgi:biopolymer transport protein ExbD
MKIVSPLPQKKARLEIIPLIDIMFFLLASFMLVSLTLTNQRAITVQLPAASGGASSLNPDAITLAVRADGAVFFEKQAIPLSQLETLLQQRLASNKDLPIYISGDSATPHGAMMAVLDYVKRCGVTKVAFNVRPVETP